MADEPGFWSAEGFPYPLLALGQTIPRGYQYQSQMTPYKRDARGDWGRALNESIDQFFGMWPQYMQQRRQFALQKNQLDRQRLADQHQAKLRPFELRQMKAEEQLRLRSMKMREDFPAMVKGLKIPEEIKEYALGQGYEAGNKFLQAYMSRKLKGRTKMIPAGTPIDGKIYSVDLQQKDDGTLSKSPEPRKMITIGPGAVIPGTDIKNTYPYALEFDPVQGTFKAPLGTSAPKELITIQPGGKFPNGTVHTGRTAIQFDPVTKTITTPFGTTPPKKLLTIQPGEAFPDGTINTTQRPVQFDPVSKTITTPLGTSAQKNLITIQPGEKDPDGNVNILKVPVQYDTASKTITTPFGKAPQEQFVRVPEGDSRLGAYPEALHKYLHINKRNNDISFHPSFTREMQQLVLKEARPSATQRFSKWLKVPGNQVQSFADLEPWTGTSLESKLWFATQNLEPNHPLHIDAQNQLNLKHVKVTPNAIIVGRGYKDPSKPDAAKRLPEPTTEEIVTGDTVSSLAKRFGTTESQIIAANPDWFEKDMNGKANVLSMRTSEQMEDAEMIIPTGKSKLSQSQINEAHSSRRRARVTEMPYGTIIPIQTATVGDGLRLNTERLDMQNIQKSVKDFVELMQNPAARGFGKIGKKEKGELEGIRQRLINNVQVLRDYGVLSPSEITNIERSVPPVNSIIALMTRGLGSDQFVIGAMNKLYEEAVNRQRQLESLIKLYGAPITDYERYSGGVPGYDATSGGSEIEILDEELNSFGG